MSVVVVTWTKQLFQSRVVTSFAFSLEKGFMCSRTCHCVLRSASGPIWGGGYMHVIWGFMCSRTCHCMLRSASGPASDKWEKRPTISYYIASEKRDLLYPTILRVRKETYNIVLRVGTCLRGGTVNTNEKRDLLYDKRDPLYLTRRRDLPQWWEC